jgi:hypothetical protein
VHPEQNPGSLCSQNKTVLHEWKSMRERAPQNQLNPCGRLAPGHTKFKAAPLEAMSALLCK